MEIQQQDFTIKVDDGSHFGATVWSSPQADANTPVILCIPAMGVRASYYQPLAKALCAQGFPVVTADLRGLGSSSVRASRASDFGYREIVELDFPALLGAVNNVLPGREVFVLGHSLGGQLACLCAAADPQAIAGLMLVASCSVYHRCWPFPKSLFVLLFEQTAALTARFFGVFPGHLVGFGDREAHQLTQDWAYQGRTGRYRTVGSTRRYEELLATSEVPVLAVSLTDDSYAPRRAVEHLLGKMPLAPKTHLHLAPQELGGNSVGHFGWVKRANRLAPKIAAWIADVRSGPVG